MRSTGDFRLLDEDSHKRVELHVPRWKMMTKIFTFVVVANRTNCTHSLTASCTVVESDFASRCCASTGIAVCSEKPGRRLASPASVIVTIFYYEC